MLSPSLGARRATRTLSFFSSGIPFSVPLTSMCYVSSPSASSSSSSFLSSFPSSSTRFHLMASRKSCSFAEKTRFFFSRGYFTITTLVRRAHIDVVVIISSSFFITPFSLALNSMSIPIVLIMLNDQLNTNTSAHNTFLSIIFFLSILIFNIYYDYHIYYFLEKQIK